MIDRFVIDGSEFAIARDLGCNLFSWVKDGCEVFHRPAGFPERGLPYQGGTPLLFPAVGRTWDRAVEPPVADVYRLADHDSLLAMPIHGFLDRCRIDAPQVEEAANCVVVTYNIEVPDTLARGSYPWTIGLHLIMTLTSRRVRIELHLRNLGAEPVPYAFGAHPYLAISDPSRNGVLLSLPVSRAVKLDPELLVPTGTTHALDEPFRLATETSYDNVYTDLSGAEAVLTDRDACRRIAVGYEDSITQFVIYAPAQAPFVCVEPWTAGLDGFSRLSNPSWRDRPPLPLLAAGAEAHVAVSIAVSEC